MAASRYRIDAPAVNAVALGRDTPPDAPPGLGLVLPASPIGLRRAVQTLAEYARHELHYDSTGYHAQAPDPNAEAWLWVIDAWDDTPRAVGFCVVLEEHPGAWALTWAWLHPFERRRRHLSNAWPFLQSRYAAFSVDRPSGAMQAFLANL
jgi:hypothetical protein